jgi:hypothetical protein
MTLQNKHISEYTMLFDFTDTKEQTHSFPNPEKEWILQIERGNSSIAFLYFTDMDGEVIYFPENIHIVKVNKENKESHDKISYIFYKRNEQDQISSVRLFSDQTYRVYIKEDDNESNFLYITSHHVWRLTQG